MTFSPRYSKRFRWIYPRQKVQARKAAFGLLKRQSLFLCLHCFVFCGRYCRGKHHWQTDLQGENPGPFQFSVVSMFAPCEFASSRATKAVAGNERIVVFVGTSLLRGTGRLREVRQSSAGLILNLLLGSRCWSVGVRGSGRGSVAGTHRPRGFRLGRFD